MKEKTIRQKIIEENKRIKAERKDNLEASSSVRFDDRLDLKDNIEDDIEDDEDKQILNRRRRRNKNHLNNQKFINNVFKTLLVALKIIGVGFFVYFGLNFVNYGYNAFINMTETSNITDTNLSTTLIDFNLLLFIPLIICIWWIFGKTFRRNM